jgi:hypothetical protein
MHENQRKANTQTPHITASNLHTGATLYYAVAILKRKSHEKQGSSMRRLDLLFVALSIATISAG